MKRTGLLLITGGIAALLVLYMGAAASTPAPGPSEIEQIKKEVTELRQRVESLEQRLTPRVLPASPTDSKAVPGVIDPYQGLRSVPRSWQQGEFNGQPYYIVPIQKKHTPPSQTAPQTTPEQSSAAPQTTNNTPKP